MYAMVTTSAVNSGNKLDDIRLQQDYFALFLGVGHYKMCGTVKLTKQKRPNNQTSMYGFNLLVVKLRAPLQSITTHT